MAMGRIEYKSARRRVKRLNKLEKKRLRKATRENIREQGGGEGDQLQVILGRLKGKEEIQESGREKKGGRGEGRKDILEVLAEHWECLGRLFWLGGDV